MRQHNMKFQTLNPAPKSKLGLATIVALIIAYAYTFLFGFLMYQIWAYRLDL